uniref:Alternative protein FAT2 n=1 Tax=Homo sapiens TaxID=9606 RepID=L8E7M5_HUMAN|nr:alternative protein FAT2 [Homo sapiens]
MRVLMAESPTVSRTAMRRPSVSTWSQVWFHPAALLQLESTTS